jgi:hypothetical protein
MSKKKMERLAAAIAEARDVLGDSASSPTAGETTAAALSELREACYAVPPNALDDQARALIKELDVRLRTLQAEAVSRLDGDLPPCRGCGGVELLRSIEPARIDMMVAGTGTDLKAEIIVCCACGEVRLVADPRQIADDKRRFRRIIVKTPPSAGPFR